MKLRIFDDAENYHSWYRNSADAIRRPPQHFYKDYAFAYNVKLHVNKYGLDAIEFPSEEEALMFMLKWS